MRKLLLTLGALCATLLGPLAVQTPLAQSAATASAATARVIVKFKADSPLLRRQAQSASVAQRADQAQALGQRLGLALTAGAGVAERTHVLFAAGIGSVDLAQRLSAESDIEFAVPDERRHALVAPNDPYYAGGAGITPATGQWYLRAPTGGVASSIDVEPAWTAGVNGSASVVVAVLDSGVRFDHPDFKRVSAGGNLLPGYDMIADLPTSNDGNGRDADASDPGDWITDAEANTPGGPYYQCTDLDSTSGRYIAQNSEWHGTMTAALIGAQTDNGTGMASIGRNVRVLPVRVLGKCGGFDSDIIAGMRWAAGLDPGDSSIPANPNVAKVINMSLGSTGTCNAAYRAAVSDITAAGTVVVASAGNGTGHPVSTPANCPGVIAVSGLRHVGSKVGFSDIGPEVLLSAPGGNCVVDPPASCQYPILSAGNFGLQGPTSNGYLTSTGTSFSAPMVAATVALMLSVDPTLTPQEVKLLLQGSARAFPTSGANNTDGTPVLECTSTQYDSSGKPIDQLQCYCSTGTCGAGMLDAGAAVLAASGRGLGRGVLARIDLDPHGAYPGHALALSAANSYAANGIASYQWDLVDGGGVVAGISNNLASAVSVTPIAKGRFVVALTVSDAQGNNSSSRLTISVGDAPALDNSSTSGGGALGVGWLVLLLGAVLALRSDPRRSLS